MSFTPFTKEDQPTMANFNEKFLSAILEGKTQALDEGVKIATGSYTGTGTYGPSNPNSLTLGFKPKYVQILTRGYNNADYVDAWFFIIDDTVSWHVKASNSYLKEVISQGSDYSASVTNDGISWWAQYSGAFQLNFNNTVYDYIAIG